MWRWVARSIKKELDPIPGAGSIKRAGSIKKSWIHKKKAGSKKKLDLIKLPKSKLP
jgi:hypothetical protein